MNDDSSTKTSWLKRLSHNLLREPQDREQLIGVLREAEQRNLFDADTLSMIEGVLQISEMQVRDIMIPRPQMAVIQEEDTLEAILKIVAESAHSRYPVTGSHRDEVIGILLAKDLLKFTGQQAKEFILKEVVRPAIFVPGSKRLDILLKEFRLKRNHMAVVVDEYGGVAGIVTIEDVLELIVGDIADEFDVDDETTIKKHSTNEFTVKAITPIDEFNDYFNTDFSDDEFDTIGGLVTHAFGHLPKRGEVVRLKNFRFEIMNADPRRIRLLKVTTPMTVEEKGI